MAPNTITIDERLTHIEEELTTIKAMLTELLHPSEPPPPGPTKGTLEWDGKS